MHDYPQLAQEKDPYTLTCDCCEEIVEDDLESGMYTHKGEVIEGELCWDCIEDKQPFEWYELDYFVSASHELRLKVLKQHVEWPFGSALDPRHRLFLELVQAYNWNDVTSLAVYRDKIYNDEKEVLLKFLIKVFTDRQYEQMVGLLASNGAGTREGENEGVAA